MMSRAAKFASIATLAALSVPAFIPDKDSIGPTPTTSTLPEGKRKVAPVRITKEIVTSDGIAVGAGTSESYGHGYIVGSPISSGKEGLFFKTYELHINQGAFADNPAYIGSTVHLSVDSQNSAIYDRFKTVEEDSREQYVFEYGHKHPLNAEIEGSKLFLKNVYTMSEFLHNLDVKSLPRGIKAKEPWAGSAGTKTKVGRIVDVERFGQLDDFCQVEVNMTGLAGAGQEKLVTLTVREEAVAQWCEKAMALGRDVEIDISQDFMEVWMPSSMVINGIKFRDEIFKPAENSLEQKMGGLSQKQYEELRDRLMNDPVFNARRRQ